MSGRSARTIAGAAATLGCVLAGPANANADPKITVTATPQVISFPNPAPVAYTLHISAGPQQEVFTIRPSGPSFTRGVFGGEGPAVGEVGFSKSGSVVLGAGFTQTADFASCRSAVPALHAASSEGSGVDVKVPANSTGELTYTFGAGPAPWPGMSLAPSFLLSNDLIGKIVDPGFGPGTLSAPMTVIGPEPIRTGASGVRINFQTKPRSAAGFGRGNPREVKAGSLLRLRGSIDPAVRGQTFAFSHATSRTSRFAEGWIFWRASLRIGRASSPIAGAPTLAACWRSGSSIGRSARASQATTRARGSTKSSSSCFSS